MNKSTRKELEKVILELEKARGIIVDNKEIVERYRDEEQEKFDNLSEGLQQSERGSAIEEAVGYLDEALTSLETLESECDTAIEYTQSAIDC